MKVIFIINFALSGIASYAQNKVSNLIKKDTIYYLLDTAQVLKQDRMFEVQPTKFHFKQYIIKSACYLYHADPYIFTLHNDTGSTIEKAIVKNLNFISLSKLNELLCNELIHFNTNHLLFIIEHMPDGRFIKRKVIAAEPPDNY